VEKVEKKRGGRPKKEVKFPTFGTIDKFLVPREPEADIPPATSADAIEPSHAADAEEPVPAFITKINAAVHAKAAARAKEAKEPTKADWIAKINAAVREKAAARAKEAKEAMESHAKEAETQTMATNRPKLRIGVYEDEHGKTHYQLLPSAERKLDADRIKKESKP
jgi:predicted phage tail protein